jgi:hypothetical protein
MARKYSSWLRLSGISGQSRTEDVLMNIKAAERSGGRLIFRNRNSLLRAGSPRFVPASAILIKKSDRLPIQMAVLCSLGYCDAGC